MIQNCKWYTYMNASIFVQKLLGEWHYWEFKTGWHPLTERAINWMVYDTDKNKEE